MNREEKRIVEGFRHWIDTNTERGVTTIPNSLCEKVYKLIVKKNPNIIEIPDNATNGDMIKALFPNAEFWDSTEFENEERINFEDNDCLECLNLDWWNAPYKKGEENENP